MVTLLNMASDELWILARWLEEVVSLKNESDPEERRRKFQCLPMAYGPEGPDRMLSRMMLDGHSVASKENDPEGELS